MNEKCHRHTYRHAKRGVYEGMFKAVGNPSAVPNKNLSLYLLF